MQVSKSAGSATVRQVGKDELVVAPDTAPVHAAPGAQALVEETPPGGAVARRPQAIEIVGDLEEARAGVALVADLVQGIVAAAADATQPGDGSVHVNQGGARRGCRAGRRSDGSAGRDAGRRRASPGRPSPRSRRSRRRTGPGRRPRSSSPGPPRRAAPSFTPPNPGSVLPRTAPRPGA